MVWFRDSHPEDDKQRVKAELSTRVYSATRTTLDPEIYLVGWTTIKIEGTGEKTHVIAIFNLSKTRITHYIRAPIFGDGGRK